MVLHCFGGLVLRTVLEDLARKHHEQVVVGDAGVPALRRSDEPEEEGDGLDATALHGVSDCCCAGGCVEGGRSSEEQRNAGSWLLPAQICFGAKTLSGGPTLCSWQWPGERGRGRRGKRPQEQGEREEGLLSALRLAPSSAETL